MRSLPCGKHCALSFGGQGQSPEAQHTVNSRGKKSQRQNFGPMSVTGTLWDLVGLITVLKGIAKI